MKVATPYTISIFRDLCDRYPDWPSLRSYLESEEGGMLRICPSTVSDLPHHVLIRYEKQQEPSIQEHVPWFRSVVWNTATHRPVCVAPPRTCSDPIPSMNDDTLRFEEFLDGFMINCFCERGSDQWQITTRSTLDGSGTFYSPKTFRQLFLETGVRMEDWIKPNMDADANEAAVCYSFVVQHPEHRVVKLIIDARSVPLQRTVIRNDGTLIVEDILHPDLLLNPSPSVDGSITEWCQAFFASNGWSFQGIVIKDGRGRRWRIRSDKYMAVKALRGNFARVIDRFSYLYTQNLTHTYLEYYPSDSFAFAFYTHCMCEEVKLIHANYIELYVRKTSVLDQVNRRYHPHLYQLHKIYLTKLKPAKKALAVSDIHSYFHRQPWQRIAFLLRATQDTYFSNVVPSMLHAASSIV